MKARIDSAVRLIHVTSNRIAYAAEVEIRLRQTSLYRCEPKSNTSAGASPVSSVWVKSAGLHKADFGRGPDIALRIYSRFKGRTTYPGHHDPIAV
ncbi:MAG: hypothetical protein EA383_01170 [Spirochaetaceae bacterium]|nr:MAG: hypothetical protein EA383_01170 [Spirochaetaceae bacterium]